MVWCTLQLRLGEVGIHEEIKLKIDLNFSSGTAVSGEDTGSVLEETEDEVEMGVDFEFPEDLAPIEPIGSDPTTEIEEISPTETVESSPAEEIDYVALVLELFNILSISSA